MIWVTEDRHGRTLMILPIRNDDGAIRYVQVKTGVRDVVALDPVQVMDVVDELLHLTQGRDLSTLLEEAFDLGAWEGRGT